jgi:thiamine biosynthesis lipoprotein
MAAFHAMGTEVTVLTPTLDEAAEGARARQVAQVFERAERRYSRFRGDSELSRLNRSTERRRVSRPLFDALVDARAWLDRTAGLFDPAVGAALIAHGYDRSFAPGRLDRTGTPCAAQAASLRELELDAEALTVLRPAHVVLDLGGFVKGRTVDAAAASIPDASLAIDAGGDALMRGDGPEGDGWLVDVEDPCDASRTLVTLRLRGGGVATSAPNRRHWRFGDASHHHLIDPRTAAPAVGDLLQATALAPTAEAADVLAKTLFLLGAAHARIWMEARPAAGAVLVHADGAFELLGAVEVADA